MPLRQLDGNTKSAEFDWRRVFRRCQKNAFRFQVPMYDVVFVAVAQSFEDLAHVVAENKIYNIS